MFPRIAYHGPINEMSEQRDPLILLGGTALRVYLTLVRAGRPVGVRELQKMLGFSSPSTALHHLRRLESLGLVKRTERGYEAVKPRGLLSLYVTIHGRLIPHTMIASSALTGALIGYALSGGDPLATSILALASLYNWLLTLWLYRSISRLTEKP